VGFVHRVSVAVVTAVAALAAVGWLAPGRAVASAPTVTLGDPANGGLITTGQPTFSGLAGNSPADTGTVIIDIYPGTTTSGSPAQILSTDVANGAYTARSLGLPDGTYTAVASEADASGNQGSSQAVTFQLFNGTPQLTLTAPAPPIDTSDPTLTGTARTDSGDSSTVEVVIYPGSSTDATPLAVLSSAVMSDGSWSVTVLPGLVNGTYTAVASQQLAFSTTFSPSVQFTVSAAAEPLTVTAPTASASEPQTGLLFSGGAGADYGDADQVGLTLYRGVQTTGTPVGSATVAVTAQSWSYAWPTPLALGTYTLVVTQADTSGPAATVTRTFKVLAPGSVTGAITVSAAGLVSARLSCLAGAGTCNGDVLIVTRTALRTVYGGPLGPLRLMFDHFSVGAAKTLTLTARLSARQLSALRRAGPTKLVVTVAYPVGTQLTETSRTTAAVRVAPVRPALTNLRRG
jgi:hypothetical protein